METRYFKPISEKKLPSAENFIFPKSAPDLHNPKLNIPTLEEIAISSGLVAGKGAIMANTLRAKRILETMTPIKYGALGFPIYSNLVIKADTYQNNAGITIGSFKEICLDAVLMEIGHENNIITTDIQGRANTIIEYIGSRSPNIHITGIIPAVTPGVYPTDTVSNLMIALNSNRSLQVVSWYLAMVKIYNIVIKGDSIKQEEGSQEYQRFEFDAIADFPVELKLQKTINNTGGIIA